MRLVTNSGGDRVIDELRQSLQGAGSLALASPQFSLFAFAETAELLGRLGVVAWCFPRAMRAIWRCSADRPIGLIGIG